MRDNPRVTAERARELAAAAATRGYEVRRARVDEYALLDAVAAEFGGAWPFELEHALTYELMLEYTGVRRRREHAPIDQAHVDALRVHPGDEAAIRHLHGDRAERELESARRELARATPGVHVVLKDGHYCAFAAHDGNNMGLGWFGPTGTWPAHRGQGLGEALLVACLVDVAAEHERCEVAWIGPRPFYEKVAGIALDRHFVVLKKPD